MTTRPSASEEQVKRVKELVRDGYIVLDNSGVAHLTDLGWRTLSAAAESKIKKPGKPSP